MSSDPKNTYETSRRECGELLGDLQEGMWARSVGGSRRRKVMQQENNGDRAGEAPLGACLKFKYLGGMQSY